MSNPNEVTGRDVQVVEDHLNRGYKLGRSDTRVDAVKFDKWSIYVRVITPGVADLVYSMRDRLVWDALHTLPDETFQKIGLLFVLDPTEIENSILNAKFEAKIARGLKRPASKIKPRPSGSATKKADATTKPIAETKTTTPIKPIPTKFSQEAGATSKRDRIKSLAHKKDQD